MTKVVGYGMLVVAVVCLFIVAMQISLFLSLSDEGLALFGSKIKERILIILFGGVLIPVGFSALILKK